MFPKEDSSSQAVFLSIMHGWTLIDTTPALWRTFRRPLDTYELGFLWDGLFNGTADSLQHLELRLLKGSQDSHLFSEENIVKAWLSTKRRYPLAGATIRDADNNTLQLKATTESNENHHIEFTSKPYFVIREYDLATLRPREVIFGTVVSAEGARRQAAEILDGPRPLSEDLLVQLYVFRETRSDVLHLMVPIAHCVTDGVANCAFVRCFLDTLARGGSAEPPHIPLKDRLAMATPSTDLEPIHIRSLSPAIRRWRRAVGIVIYQLKMEKRQGGHTLPCRLTSSTPYTAARSGTVSASLTDTQTSAVFSNCRLLSMTFGNAYLSLAQVAMTRVLYRQYLRGQISEEEWAYRKRQPYISGGPLNLRPYLDKEWFENGGAGEFMLSISFFHFQLPFMTLGSDTTPAQRNLSGGAPPFSDLLTFDRFLHRAWLVKKQAEAFFSHPLFFEIALAASTARLQCTRLGAQQWMSRVTPANGQDPQGDSVNAPLNVTDIPNIWAHGGSSIGNLDLISPTEYPLPPTHPLSPYCPVPHPIRAGYVTHPVPPAPDSPTAVAAPTIVVEKLNMHLHTRPAELYLGASSARGRLNLYVFYDRNVFDDGVVREWLDEVKEAVLWYLGQRHRSCRGRKGDALQSKL